MVLLIVGVDFAKRHSAVYKKLDVWNLIGSARSCVLAACSVARVYTWSNINPLLLFAHVPSQAGFIVDDIVLVPRPTVLPQGTGMRGWLSMFTTSFLKALPEEVRNDGESWSSTVSLYYIIVS